MSKPLTRNEKLTLWISTITGSASIIALGLSLWSNHVSAKAYDLSQQSYYDDRRIFLKTEVTAGANPIKGLHFLPLESNAQIAWVEIFFPSKLGIDSIGLAAPDFDLSEALLDENVRIYLDRMTPASPGHAGVRPHFPIPALILVKGYTKGKAVATAGIYDFNFEYVRPADGGSTIRIRAAALNNYVESVDAPQKMIDDLFVKIEARLAVQAP